MRALANLAAAAVAVIAVAGASGCSTKAPDRAAPTAEGFRADVEDICFAEQRSGALEQEEGARAMVVATWLAREVETPEGRALLGELGPLAPPDKSARLRAAAAEAGLSDCPTATTWR